MNLFPYLDLGSSLSSHFLSLSSAATNFCVLALLRWIKTSHLDSLSEKDRTPLTMSTASNVIFLPSSHDSQTSSGGAPSEASSARSNYDTPKNVLGVSLLNHFIMAPYRFSNAYPENLLGTPSAYFVKYIIVIRTASNGSPRCLRYLIIYNHLKSFGSRSATAAVFHSFL